MKFFALLFFSSFVYAQDPQNNNSTQQNDAQGDMQAPSEDKMPKAPAPLEGEKQSPSTEANKPDTAQPEDKKQSPSTEANKSDTAQPEDKKQSPSTEANKPDTAPKSNTTNEAQKSAVQVINNQPTVSVPPQPMEVPPEEPIPYYNPLHPQSPSTYQEGDLPSEVFSDMTASKTRKHRFSIGGKPFDYLMQGDRKEINLNASADYGYSRKYFEVGPYASIEVHKFNVDLDRFQDALILNIGAFFEVNFMANANHAKNIPSIGLKAGYKRKENMNYIVGQLYVTMKFFLNHQTAFFASLAPYYQYKLQGEKGEWGVEIPIGLRYYFY